MANVVEFFGFRRYDYTFPFPEMLKVFQTLIFASGLWEKAVFLSAFHVKLGINLN